MIDELAIHIAKRLTEQRLTLALAESSTGGLISAQFARIPGSSAYLKGGVVAYSHEAKSQILQAPLPTLITHGTVSAETALALAHGARKIFNADIGLAETGISGPSGGTPEKPVGLTFIALVADDYEMAERHVWSHDRVGNQQATVKAALQLLGAAMEKIPNPKSQIPNPKSQAPNPKSPTSADLQSPTANLQYPTLVSGDLQSDGTLRPHSFVWQGQTLQIASVGRQWVEGERRHVLVMTANHETFELSGAVNWTAQRVGGGGMSA